MTGTAHLDGADYVVSSLCVHHLNGDENKPCSSKFEPQLLSARGVFILADIVPPQWALRGGSCLRKCWLLLVQSMAVDGATEAFELFK